ncbi:MAG TPA: hypothetical protein VGL72_03390 [Bryobacteraceae bacterium]
MSLLGRWPYRCQMCDMRFNGPQDPASIAREAAHQERLHEEEFVDDESEDSSDESKK